MGKLHLVAGNFTSLFHFDLIPVKQPTVCVGRRDASHFQAALDVLYVFLSNLWVETGLSGE